MIARGTSSSFSVWNRDPLGLSVQFKNRADRPEKSKLCPSHRARWLAFNVIAIHLFGMARGASRAIKSSLRLNR